MSQDNKLSLIFVVSGEEIPYAAPIHAPLHSVLGAVLKEAQAGTRTDPSEWDFATESGIPLDPAQKIEALGLHAGEKVFMKLKMAGGGE